MFPLCLLSWCISPSDLGRRAHALLTEHLLPSLWSLLQFLQTPAWLGLLLYATPLCSCWMMGWGNVQLYLVLSGLTSLWFQPTTCLVPPWLPLHVTWWSSSVFPSGFCSTTVFQHRVLWKSILHLMLNLNAFNYFREYKNGAEGNEK